MKSFSLEILKLHESISSPAGAGVVAGPSVEVFDTGVVDITEVVIDGTTVNVEGDS